MSKPVEPAMDKATLKRLLTNTADEPVNCAVGSGKDGAQILLHKTRNGKALEKELDSLFPKLDILRFGTAQPMPDDPTTVRFIINRAAGGGLAKKLAKALKGTGFKRVELGLDDGTVLEGAGDEEEQAAAPEELSAPVMPDKAAFRDLVAQIGTTPMDPLTKVKLAGLAKEANAAMTAGDAKAASEAVLQIRTALEHPQPLPEKPGPSPGPQGEAVVLGKARLAWMATRTKIDGEVAQLRAKLAEVYEDRGLAPRVTAALDTKVGMLIGEGEDRLAELLANAANAASPEKRTAFVLEAKAQIAKYQAALTGSDFAGLDENPAQKLTIRKIVGATMTGLSAAIH